MVFPLSSPPSPSSSLRRSLLIRVALLVFFSIGIFFLGLYVLILRPTVERLTAREMENAMQAMHGRIAQEFEQIETIARIARTWGRHGQLDVDDVAGFNQRFTPILRQMPMVFGAILADDTGRGIVLQRLPGGQWENFIADPGGMYRESWQDEQTRLTRQPTGRPFDPRQRPWFQGVMSLADDSLLHWTAPYISITTQQADITLSARWQHGGQNYVIAFDLALADLARFTATLPVGRRGHAAILTADARLLAPPPGADSSDAALQAAVLSRAADFPNAALVRAVQQWQDKGQQPIDNFLDRHYWVSSMRPYRLQNQELWLLAQAPLGDFVPGAQRDLALLTLLTLFALGVGFVMAARLARRVSAPLRTLADASERIGTLDFTPNPHAGTGWHEIDRLAKAQENMRQALQDATVGLEERVAQRTAEFSQARAVAEEATRAKSVFLANMRTPSSAWRIWP